MKPSLNHMTGQRNFGSKTAKQKIRKKGEGVGIMACAFVSAQVGYTCDNHIYLYVTHTHMCVYHDRQWNHKENVYSSIFHYSGGSFDRSLLPPPPPQDRPPKKSLKFKFEDLVTFYEQIQTPQNFVFWITPCSSKVTGWQRIWGLKTCPTHTITLDVGAPLTHQLLSPVLLLWM